LGVVAALTVLVTVVEHRRRPRDTGRVAFNANNVSLITAANEHPSWSLITAQDLTRK
jgi:hypothetical protein